eukprot:TRINITY_DN6729_c0_g1_i12.p2 TRINITY_DN6729_c0_g1~~TRINITY_DN6729_c0_g1_i12.p2  ORF type:complete len:108 (-),score=7.07 TRINITY_DN6729_c0_g1_i12:77-400(-)
MIRRPPRSTQSRSSAASDVYKRQVVYDMMCKYSFRQAFYRQVERGNRWYAVNINNTTNMKAKGENSTNKAQPQGRLQHILCFTSKKSWQLRSLRHHRRPSQPSSYPF